MARIDSFGDEVERFTRFDPLTGLKLEDSTRQCQVSSPAETQFGSCRSAEVNCLGGKSRLHHPLDVSLDEDHRRVRHPNAALVLGLFRRGVVSCALVWLAAVQSRKTRFRRAAVPAAVQTA